MHGFGLNEVRYIYRAYHGGKQTCKGETNDGVDPLKGEEDVEVGVTKSRGNKL